MDDRARRSGSEAEADEGVRSIVERAFRVDHGRIMATLTRDLGDLGLAEDALQDAFVEALRSWPARGAPSVPTAWIITTARRRAIDRLRRSAVGDSKVRELSVAGVGDGVDDPVFDELMVDADIADDRLALIFTCCHPALARSDAVALTLRTVVGLSTADLGVAFLVKESTMAARLTRAKAKVARAGIPYRVPEHHELPERLGTVIDVITLIYNHGYTPPASEALIDVVRVEAIGLAAIVAEHLPDEPEALALHALLLLHEVRQPARLDADGELVRLDEQDRTRWNTELLAPAIALLRRASKLGPIGRCQAQALISAAHSTASSTDTTDWAHIVDCYNHLLALDPAPTTEIARAVAIGMAAGPDAGLRSLPPPLPPLDTFHRWHAARADLLARGGDTGAAAGAYRRAAELASNPAERRWLERAARTVFVTNEPS